MGDSKRRQRSKDHFLREHPFCCYCGEPATTIDHFPPRSFFVSRKWPMSFDFPSCKTCNQEGRSSEQVASVVLRLSPMNSVSDKELRRMCTGIQNNQPRIVEEWLSKTPFWEATALDRIPGELGRTFKRQGMKALYVGPLTMEHIGYFELKLARALFYKHTGRRLVGVVFSTMMSAFQSNDLFDNLLPMVPHLHDIRHQKEDLKEQFIYRYNLDPRRGAFSSLSLFNGQFGFFNYAFEKAFYNDVLCKEPELLTKLTEAFGACNVVTGARPQI